MARKMMDNDILSSKQKKELSGIIESLVEERVKENQSKFIEKYTSFIVESATKKLSGKIKDSLTEEMTAKVDEANDKAQRLCRSVILESSNKISTYKKNQEKLVEEFKNTAPKLIEKLAEERAEEIQAEAIDTIDKYKKDVQIVESMKDTLAKVGFIINEDVDDVVKTKSNEVMNLKTKLNRAERDLKVSELTEGMLPNQKEKMSTILEEYSSSSEVEKHFKSIKEKVLVENTVVETKEVIVPIEKTELEKKMLHEEQFSNFLSSSKEFMNKI